MLLRLVEDICIVPLLAARSLAGLITLDQAATSRRARPPNGSACSHTNRRLRLVEFPTAHPTRSSFWNSSVAPLTGAAAGAFPVAIAAPPGCAASTMKDLAYPRKAG